MAEFDDSTDTIDTTDTSDTGEALESDLLDTPGNDLWEGVDTETLSAASEDISAAAEIPAVQDTNEALSVEVPTDLPEPAALTAEELHAEAGKAADYAREMGFDKAADYIERHYDGGVFEPGEPIRVNTRNAALEGAAAANGVPFERSVATLTDGLQLEGVFPNFASRHDVHLGQSARDMSLHQVFNACKADYQDHMFDSPEKLQGLTVGDMLKLEDPKGYAPAGLTWQHQPETGELALVDSRQHRVSHTGGNAFWQGNGREKQ